MTPEASIRAALEAFRRVEGKRGLVEWADACDAYDEATNPDAITALLAELDAERLARDRAENELGKAFTERDTLRDRIYALTSERDAALAELDAARKERDAAFNLAAMRAEACLRIQSERDAAIAQRDAIQLCYENLQRCHDDPPADLQERVLKAAGLWDVIQQRDAAIARAREAEANEKRYLWLKPRAYAIEDGLGEFIDASIDRALAQSTPNEADHA